MLQVKDISKQYKTGTLVQQALNHVSLNLRDNEFVAILGPSGSGKTTLLNIIGGLDRYDSGDLVINGVSTKKYKDRDWDSYRNHTIGFVFQSYNLIPHQTVLANVELALTIGGISRAERRRRAADALRKVGLGEQMHKKPSQMSGGQMQRVAIARALVNDPDILLADEPTGALDSETSIQVMDLLKEVANDRLVVMVTHNPELAEQYATRIVRVKDGMVIADTDPYEVAEEEAVHRNFGKSSMSFFTALGLSFNNLKTKLARTLLVALAGSIGITGIALILSLSNGVNQYIQNVQEDTLSEYPLEITGASFDLGAFMGVQVESWRSEAEVVEWKTISNMLTKITANDLGSLKTFLESGESGIEPYTRAIEYRYSFAPEIYCVQGDDFFQSNPDTTFSQMGFSNMSAIMRGSNTNSFMSLPREKDLYIDQYEVMAGRWGENDHELVLVLTESGRVADLTLYAMGMKDHSELEELVKGYMTGEEIDIDEHVSEFSYTDFIGLTYKMVHSCDYYQYDSEYNVWTSKRDDKRYMRNLIDNGETLTVVGVVKPREDANVSMLSSGVYFDPDLVKSAVAYAEKSAIVQTQLAAPETDIISNVPFGEQSEGGFDLQNLFSVDEEALQQAIQFDSSAMEFDFPGISASGLDFSSLDFSGLDMPEMDFSELLGKVKFNFSSEDMQALFDDLMADYAATQTDPTADISKLPAAMGSYLLSADARKVLRDGISDIIASGDYETVTQEALQEAVTAVVNGYLAYAQEKELTDLSGLRDYLSTQEARDLIAQQARAVAQRIASVEISQESVEALQTALSEGYAAYAAANNLPDVQKAQQGFLTWLSSATVQQRIMDTAMGMIDTEGLQSAVADMMGGFTSELEKVVTKTMTTVMTQMANRISWAISDAMSGMGEKMENALKIDTDAFGRAFKVSMTEEELQELMAVMMTKTVTSFDGNLSKMGYMDLSKPSSIVIYPRDFESKAQIKEILNAYNDRMRETEQEEKVVSFTDIVGTLMSSVTDIINAISYVLVAFVAISLVVSSIMIGVITYISVLERKKEIGILRAIGASKRNISNVFNAETFIIGLLAGLLGVGVTEILLIPGNILIHYLADMDDISAAMPPVAGVILVSLSVILTLIGGIIPSRKAAKSDPVTALRTE